MWTRHDPSLMLAAAAMGLVSVAAMGATPIEKSGDTYNKPVCPKSAGPLVMRCHAHVVTDSKGNPVQTAAPAPRPQSPPELPNGKRPDR